MKLPVRDFTAIIRDMSAAITASSGKLIDVSVGSVLRAIIEANASIVLWVQWIVLLTLQTTRAATSNGPDLDSWMADFSLLRRQAVAASGVTTFARFSGTTAAFVPVGTTVKTQDGAISFVVVADSNNSAWQPSEGAYCLAVGVTAVDLPVIATTGGLSGNVLASTITLLASATPGIDYISNPTFTYGGIDTEADSALRIRFADFFASRSRATKDAIAYAVSLVGPELNYTICENADAAGGFRSGSVLLIVDDGSGSLTSSLFDALSLAIERVRPVGTSFSIQPPTIVRVEVSLSVQLLPETSVSEVQAELRSAIGLYINTRPIGGTLSLTRISQLVYLTEPSVVNVSNVLINGQQADLTAPPTGSLKFLSLAFL
jgi:uncharacterized phage protein gp47/JayE